MPKLCIYFQAHQPNRLRPYSFFDMGNIPFYEDDELNRHYLSRASERCYLPANRMFMEAIAEHDGQFQIALSLSGVLIEQLEHHRPDVLDSFRELVATGCVELLCETYYHSMCYRASGLEFTRQVELQKKKIAEVFAGMEPRIFRHSELVFYNEMAAFVEKLGFEGMLCEGVPTLLAGRTPNALYRSPGTQSLKTFTRNGALSDDIGFRFRDSAWAEYPLTSEKFARWITESEGDLVNLFLDYETIGEHDSGEEDIFEFWRSLPGAVLAAGGGFITPSQAVDDLPTRGIYDCHHATSWADAAKDLSPWQGNPMQHEARKKILALEKQVKAAADPELLHQWSKMQTSDHLYYMSTKGGDDGMVHEYFRPYNTPYDAYIYFMNALSDLQIRLGRLGLSPGGESLLSGEES